MSRRLTDFAEAIVLEQVEDADLLRAAEARGYLVHKPRPIESPVLDISRISGTDRLRVAVVSCTHFGSKYQQLTALREFCEYADRVAKVNLFIHAGASSHSSPSPAA